MEVLILSGGLMKRLGACLLRSCCRRLMMLLAWEWISLPIVLFDNKFTVILATYLVFIADIWVFCIHSLNPFLLLTTSYNWHSLSINNSNSRIRADSDFLSHKAFTDNTVSACPVIPLPSNQFGTYSELLLLLSSWHYRLHQLTF